MGGVVGFQPKLYWVGVRVGFWQYNMILMNIQETRSHPSMGQIFSLKWPKFVESTKTRLIWDMVSQNQVFHQIVCYFADLFRQIVCYLAEVFCQIVCYLAELFRQIVCYLAELFRQIAFPPKNQRTKKLKPYLFRSQTFCERSEQAPRRVRNSKGQ